MSSRLLEIRDATYRYGARIAIGGVSLSIPPGQIYALLGPNGAGKSTLVRAISGRIRLDSGSIRVAGGDPAESAAARREIGLVPQQIALFEKLTPQENLAAIGQIMGVGRKNLKERIPAALTQIAIGDRAGDRVETLSGGMRRRVNIAAALLHRPSLLVLDEPTVGVDEAGRRALRDLLQNLRNNGLAILLTTHEMEEAEALADHVGIIAAGRMHADGTPSQLVEQQFGAGMELVVRFDAAEGQHLMPLLAPLGVSLDATTSQWKGIVDPDAGPIRALIDRLLASRARGLDIRLRRPGLDTLLRRLTQMDPAG